MDYLDTLYFSSQQRQLALVLGDLFLLGAEFTEQERRFTVTTYPTFDSTAAQPKSDDIGIATISGNELTLSETVNVISLASEAPTEGSQVTVFGWGQTSGFNIQGASQYSCP
jgi:hypothetical protein